ncbi:hypothetical protein DH2020_032155 [Rehmannia glutinosa]|uniref:Protein kinase domain-containing protein n=1 Tax=Rehmannia glutinosa TaxID=99300 RepID=A0ABR0VJB6_REHGL
MQRSSSQSKLGANRSVFFAQNYTRFPGCPGFVVFYRSPANGSYNGEFAVPEDCQAVRLPFGGSENWEQSSGIFSGLSAEFDVEWNVSDACLDCNRRGGRCGTDSINEFVCREDVGNRILRIILITGGVILAALSVTLIILLILFRKQYIITSKWPIIHRVKTGKEKDIELFLNEGNIVTRRYKYAYIKKITKSLKEKLGEGGYGSVYKGQLPDGRLVAVKMLNESKGNGGEFINEVASISRTSHINIVTLMGFCFEGSKRALVYEFMPNGSLEKYIQNAEEGLGLGWEKLTDIALGIARGLEYLHQGCNTRILHFDMKPHNILLDKDFNPKISDFGLAKLCPNRSSIVSMLGARGTVGYIAPEVFCRNFGEVSYKSDVYSYGMIVLEMAGGTKNIDRDDVDRTSEIYFPQYIYKELEMDAKGGDGIDGIKEDESQIAKRKLIIVGLWCIQTDPKNRPPMSKVVEMLEGKLESLYVPPNPYYFSPIPKAPPSFSTSRSL